MPSVTEGPRPGPSVEETGTGADARTDRQPIGGRPSGATVWGMPPGGGKAAKSRLGAAPRAADATSDSLI